MTRESAELLFRGVLLWDPAWHAPLGWGLVLAGFVGGALLGPVFLFGRDGILGGYADPRRRLVRLGHVACAALGILHLAAAGLAPPPLAGAALALGAVSMPIACVAGALAPRLRFLLVLPSAALIAGATLALVAALA